MSNLFLGRLIPCEAFMSIDADKSRSFRFDLDLGWKGLSDIERARKITDDVLLDIQMKTLYMEVKNSTPIKFQWEEFHIGDKRGNDGIRIPQSDWSKLKADLGYGKMRIIEVTEETYQLVEEYMKKTKTIEIDDAINNAMLELLKPK
jgi:CRISPR/Cas system CSM-associated protein Csm2 small subunit